MYEWRVNGITPKAIWHIVKAAAAHAIAPHSTHPLTPPPDRATLVSVTDMSKPTDLVQGTLDLLILTILAVEPMHGWAIAQRIRQMSNEVLQVGQSALYPALHKLEQQGWIKAEWAVSESNRRARFYSLTRAGRKALQKEAAQWDRLSAAISFIVRTA